MHNNISHIIENNMELNKYLFVRGFLITKNDYSLQKYPFYNNWSKKKISSTGFNLYLHNKQSAFVFEHEGVTVVLVGHAYNPFTMEIDETEILKRLLCEYANKGLDAFIEKYNELTGLFFISIFDSNKIFSFTDCAGMYCSYYGCVNENVVFTSHFQLVADLENLCQDPYVVELVKYKWYPKYGNFLPGDLSAYSELKRVVPNTFVKYKNERFSVERFYPKKGEINNNSVDYNETIKEIASILNKNLELISKKWSKPAISLTGGMDSKTTLACANGLYDKFKYFSYISMYGESIDANAAHRIAEAVGVNHTIHHISEKLVKEKTFNDIKLILSHNFGNIGFPNDNDVNKRVFYFNTSEFDVEVKSWVSEVGRANYYKKFGKRKMPNPLTPRQMSTMYKVFLHNRSLLHKTDSIFKEYIKITKFDFPSKYDSSDMYLWELRYGSWGGMVITCEHMVSFDITIPYNNRLLMDLFFELPLEYRIVDKPHEDIIKQMNEKITQTGINVVNYNETKKRMYIEKMYFNFNTHIPF